MLLLKLRDDVRTAMNRNEVTLPILIDYSKVFDTIDHCFLQEKLQNMNFAKNTINIICSYLIERYQLCINGTLRVLWKFGRFTPTKVRKTLAEALILSKINYCNVSDQ